MWRRTLVAAILAIEIQSRARDELVWRDEVWKRNHLTAYLTARAKARLTGRVYRLLDQDGAVIEQFRETGH
jgi:hypothetical protein